MQPTLILHGGAGSMTNMTDARAARYRHGLREAARTGVERLQAGEGALEAAVAVTVAMEDSGIYNAGLGSCLTSAGTIEMDAALMDGRNRDFGAVAGVPGVANPILLARHVMEDTEHCLLGAEGAADFARRLGLTFRQDFPSSARLKDWEQKRQALGSLVGVESLSERVAALGGVLGEKEEDPVGRGDTVGVCVLDREGNLAAAVSTGGIWMKMPGRIGDSPLPGAGLWAVNDSGAAVATGTGEAILRVLLCREVVDRMNGGAQAGCSAGIALLEEAFGVGGGGVVGIDPAGEASFAFNTRGMGRALWREGSEEIATAIWPDEEWDRVLPG